MTSEVRGEFHRELDRLDIAVGSLLGLIPDAVQRATTALLVADAEISSGLQRWRTLVEELYGDVGHTIEVVVARQSPVAGDLRFLLACVRLVPALHETIDLVAEVASPSHLEIGPHLPPRVIALLEQLGSDAAGAWASVGRLWAERQGELIDVIGEQVDAVADLRSMLSAELASGSSALPVALELAVVAKTLDRIGRHARSAARVIAPLVPGGPPA